MIFHSKGTRSSELKRKKKRLGKSGFEEIDIKLISTFFVSDVLLSSYLQDFLIGGKLPGKYIKNRKRFSGFCKIAFLVVLISSRFFGFFLRKENALFSVSLAN